MAYNNGSGLFTVKEFYNRGVIKLAPDVLVYIGGSLSTKIIAPVSGQDSKVSFNDGITTVSVQNNVDPPGSSTASFEVTTPIYGENSNYWVSYENIDSATPVRAPLLIPMMEVKIYFKGRFMAKGAPKYYPAFWGFITNVEENYSGGVYKLNVSCADMLHWWAYSTINVHPVPQSRLIAGGGQDLSIFSTVFNRRNPFQIIYQLVTGMGMHEFVTPAWLAQKLPKETVYPKSVFQDQATNGIMPYWQKRFGNMTSLLKMFGVSGKQVIYNDVVAMRPVSTAPDKSRKSQMLKATESKDRRNLDVDYDFITKFETFADYKKMGSFDNAEYMTKLQIATEIKTRIDYEFYQDVDGNFIFKPPFYNLNVRGLQPYTILPNDILSYSVNTDTEGLITVLSVYTPMYKNLKETPFNRGLGFHMDIELSKKFGIRHQEMTMSYVNDADLARSLALGQLNIINAKITTGSVTIPGRPEMRLGYPIYLEHRDSFHYVRSINHSFDYGGSFTTTLSLQTERKKVWDTGDDGNLVLLKDKVYRYKEPVVPVKKEEPIETKDKQPVKKDTKPKRSVTSSIQEEPPQTLVITDQVELDQMNLLEGERRIVSMKQGRYEISPRRDPLTHPRISVNGRVYQTGKDERAVTSTTTPYTDVDGYQVFGSFPYGRNLNPVSILPNTTDNADLVVYKDNYLATMARPLYKEESKNMDALFFEDRAGSVPDYLGINGMPSILGVISDESNVLDNTSPKTNESKVKKVRANQADRAVAAQVTGATYNTNAGSKNTNALVNTQTVER